MVAAPARPPDDDPILVYNPGHTVAAAGRPAISIADLEALDIDNHPTATERRAACPICDDRPREGGRRALSFNTQTGLWVCYRCEAKGKLTDFWEERPKLTRREQTAAHLRRAFSLPPREAPELDPDDAPWREWFVNAVPLAGTPGEAYLAGRGIPLVLAAAAGVVYTGRWYRRPAILYPLHDGGGTLTAVGGRFVDDLAGTPKPWAPDEAFSKTQVAGRLKYGAFTLPGAFSGDTVVIVEGPADALSLALCGVPAVALHRTSAPDWVVKRCAFKRVLVALDADTGGDAGADRLSAALCSYGAKPERVRSPEPKDWNDFLAAQGAAALREWFFTALAEPPLRQARQLTGRRPLHEALGVAIDAMDWPVFEREVGRYERGEVVAEGYCPSCKALMDGETCWACSARPCRGCGTPTGSALRPECGACERAAFQSQWIDEMNKGGIV